MSADDLRGAGEAQPLPVRRARAATTACTRSRSLFEPLDAGRRARRSASRGAAADEVICPEVEGPNLAERALTALRERGWDGAAAAGRDREADPGRGRPRRRQRRRRRGAAARPRRGRGDLRALAAAVGADVPSQLSPRPCLVAGAGEVVEPIPPPGRARRRPDPADGGPDDRRRLRRGRPARLGRGEARARGDPPQAPRRRRRGRLAARLPRALSSTTCSRRRSRCGPRSSGRSRRSGRRAPSTRW